MSPATDSVIPPQQHGTSDDGHLEEGELQGTRPAGNEWEDYIIATPASPFPESADSPSEDIGGFHALMERAASRFQLPMAVKYSDYFLYDFKDQSWNTVRAIPKIDHIWEEGVKVTRTPAK